MRMPGPDQHRRPAVDSHPDPLAEGIQPTQSAFRIDHIKAGYMRRIGRNPTLVRHQRNQIPHPPTPLRIKPHEHPRIPSSKKPITPKTHLPRSSHDPSKPSSQKMSAKGSGTQHVSDGDGWGNTGMAERANTALLG